MDCMCVVCEKNITSETSTSETFTCDYCYHLFHMECVFNSYIIKGRCGLCPHVCDPKEIKNVPKQKAISFLWSILPTASQVIVNRSLAYIRYHFSEDDLKVYESLCKSHGFEVKPTCSHRWTYLCMLLGFLLAGIVHLTLSPYGECP